MESKIDKILILNKIKSHYGFNTDADFARFLDIKPNTLSNWYIRNTFDPERIFTKCEDIDGNFIISGEEPMLKANSAFEVKKGTNKNNHLPQVIVVDSNNDENIPLVPVKARAGYLDGYYKPKFMRTLPTYRVPGLNNGTFRMFENKGNSMHPTLPNRSIAVGEWVENWKDDIRDGRIYIIVHDDWEESEDGVLIKRCLNRISKYNNLLCKSDNIDRVSYPNINLNPIYIKEVWELKGAFTFEFPDPSNLFSRLDDLEAEMEQLKRNLLK